MKVDYDKQTINAKNFFAKYAHRTRLEISVKIISNYFQNKQISLLDFGCGDGFFLNQLSKKFSNFELIGYDPYSKITHKSFRLINKMDVIKKKTLDIICCFETLEHLNKDEKDILYSDISKMLKVGGKFIVSVPIIGGLTLILKEINRMFMFRRKSDYSLKELVFATFFNISAKRTDNIKTSHKGFNFQKLENELKEKFLLRSKIYSPFKHIPWYLNSNVFYVLENKE